MIKIIWCMSSNDACNIEVLNARLRPAMICVDFVYKTLDFLQFL